MFLSLSFWLFVLLFLAVRYYILPWIRNHNIRNIRGPALAAFSNLWLLYYCRKGKRYLAVDEAHKKYGTLVRIQPNHVSIADDEAINSIYGHGNGFLKSYFICSDYYDAFVSIRRGLFNTRDRAEHTRKRKIVSHTFSMKSVVQFEQYMLNNLEIFLSQWNRLSNLARGDYCRIDALPWLNYLAFDIIGDLAFGAPFGMLEKGEDVAEIRVSPDAPPSYASAIDVINRRGEVSGTLGCLPSLIPYAKYIPDSFFTKGVESIGKLAGIAIARVKERLANAQNIDRVDLLARLMEARDENGEKLGREELTAEALTQLIAGSDTTSNTSCALLFHTLKSPEVVSKLQKELDEALPEPGVPTYQLIKDLTYLDSVIKETMRVHSTSSLGLPRVVVGDGLTLNDHFFPAGTVLSIPSYTIHHSKKIWGEDADDFRPERWTTLTERQKKAFIPFSFGPRACVGRNVAEIEMALIASTIFRNFEFQLEQDVLETREGFLRKPLFLKVGMRKRKI
ncbi:Benzoate 4-monooxygenase bphA [Pseudolycoriella hygida]|uniref:Benzoate 4-monooxygenase bphA n=1 Tax=Pseudolycoriella hygida TaxID=35572 RepID=A0A9Q0RVL1_9DIPT|nr:Benzoate 4-monooxygenase bphA [Pseudolycoriella hygida]